MPAKKKSVAKAKQADVETEKIKPGKLKRAGRFLARNWWKILIVIVILVALGLFASEYMNTRDQLNQLKNPKTAGQTEIQIVTDQVGKSVDLPGTETPTLATVSDASKLKNQAFFKNAENGDKVLIYTKTGRALLYRPSSKKVIEYSNVSLSDGQQKVPQQ